MTGAHRAEQTDPHLRIVLQPATPRRIGRRRRALVRYVLAVALHRAPGLPTRSAPPGRHRVGR